MSVLSNTKVNLVLHRSFCLVCKCKLALSTGPEAKSLQRCVGAGERENRKMIKVLRIFQKSKRTESFFVMQYLKEFSKK